MPRPTRPADHRARAGRERRERTRRALIESAMLVFARRGVEASVIDEVIELAGVARGTFYNHFRGNDDLLAAVAAEAGDQLLAIVNPRVIEHEDAAARVATGVRLVLALARAHPAFAAFLARVGPRAVAGSNLTTRAVPRDLALGVRTGRFLRVPPRLGFDLVIGPVFAAFQAIALSSPPAGYEAGIARGILLALGVPRADAERLARMRLPPVTAGADSLLARVDARARTSPR
ncbi:MAG: helix-turn-helix transcriptional regulator [Burkholderiales bacterium]|nr:helix-turn-helix transcriptional regulator [Burkholderiales bacterium]